MALPADPRDRLAQIPADKLRKMYMPHTLPIPKGDPKVEGKASGVTNIFVLGGIDPKALLGLMLKAMRHG